MEFLGLPLIILAAVVIFGFKAVCIVPQQQAHIPLAVTYVDTTEITRRIDALERQLTLTQEKAQRAADEGKAGVTADIEKQRKEVQHLQTRLAESDRRATISIVIGGIALLIAVLAVVWQLLHLGS